MRFLACVAVIAFACASSTPIATKLHLKSEGGALYATIGGAEKKVTDTALKAWLIDSGREVLYSGRDGAGGYENEGQSLRLYDVSTRRTRKILSEYFVITGVLELKTNSGKAAILVEMTDGGLGAAHVAVVDPKRGEVFSTDGAKVVDRGAGTIVLGLYRDQDWEKLNANREVRPFKTERYDLDELLLRPVIVNKVVR
ncbi:MAG: hypothetical protein ACRD9L_14860 [Bryobacteraceae bacterium]